MDSPSGLVCLWDVEGGPISVERQDLLGDRRQVIKITSGPTAREVVG